MERDFQELIGLSEGLRSINLFPFLPGPKSSNNPEVRSQIGKRRIKIASAKPKTAREEKRSITAIRMRTIPENILIPLGAPPLNRPAKKDQNKAIATRAKNAADK
ncbi:hypothetical protein HC174_11320 [Salinimicrobium sp. CDJ15-81-2]|nr:hypothetical protein [Salinimicrobium nanhaiense]